LNIGKACGVKIVGAASASDKSSIVGRLGAPFDSSSFAPFNDVSGEYNTEMVPLARPVMI
jgi:hypothetical protein